MIYKEQVLVVEPTGIEPVADVSRHGRARGLFGVWFSANAEIATWMIGVFIAAWLISYLVYKLKKFDEHEQPLTNRV